MSFVILDEAQNATDDQLKMFLTRLGSGSTMVVTGDATQIDLPFGRAQRIAGGRLTLDRSRRRVDRRTRRDRRRASPTRDAHHRGVREAGAETRVIYYRNDVRRSGVDGRALVATARRLLGAMGEERTRPFALARQRRGDSRLNREYRGRDAATDVLSFAIEDESRIGRTGRLLGDVVISIETARRQAAAYDAPLAREIYRLLIHGLLHSGHDHEAAAERAAMESGERRLADAISLPWPYADALIASRNRRAREMPHYRLRADCRESSSLRSFHHAFEGIIYAARTQPNMRCTCIALLVLLARCLCGWIAITSSRRSL